MVQDGFHPTPTTELADLVLPAAIWGEKEGTYTNSERRVSKVNRPSRRLAKRAPTSTFFSIWRRELGCCEELFTGWRRSKMHSMNGGASQREGLCDYSGITYEAIEQHGGIQWPFPDNGDSLDPTVTSRLTPTEIFQTADGKARLICADWEPFPEQPTQEFPLMLNTGRTVEHWHTRTKTGAVPILESLSPRAWLEMNPRDC